MKDSSQINKKIPKNNPTSWCEYYFIKRTGPNNSEIIPLPKNLKRKSEYVYLFDIFIISRTRQFVKRYEINLSIGYAILRQSLQLSLHIRLH